MTNVHLRTSGVVASRIDDSIYLRAIYKTCTRRYAPHTYTNPSVVYDLWFGFPLIVSMSMAILDTVCSCAIISCI